MNTNPMRLRGTPGLNSVTPAAKWHWNTACGFNRRCQPSARKLSQVPKGRRMSRNDIRLRRDAASNPLVFPSATGR